MDVAPLVPDYAGGCLNNLIPALLGPGRSSNLPAWFPEPAREARQTVLLVLDGLGWHQLQARQALAPVLVGMAGGAIDAVAPTTTATALVSITTGLTPGEHGVVGYRMAIHGEVLNVLRWSTPVGDARRRLVPGQVQPIRPFHERVHRGSPGGRSPPSLAAAVQPAGGGAAAGGGGGAVRVRVLRRDRQDRPRARPG